MKDRRHAVVFRGPPEVLDLILGQVERAGGQVLSRATVEGPGDSLAIVKNGGVVVQG